LVTLVLFMTINAIPASAQSGIMQGINRLQENASTIANNSSQVSGDSALQEKPSVDQSLVDMKLNQRDIELSVESLKAEDKMIGHLLDVTA